MLRAHVEKGDPRDVANFACFLWNRGEGIAPQQPKAVCTCPSGDGSLRWPCPKHPPQQPEAQEAAVAIPADSVDGELSVEKAINDLCEMHPGADRLAMKLLAALFTHRTVVRYKAGNTAQQPAPVVPEGMVLAEVLRRVAADPDGLLVLARLAKAETGRLRERFAAMLAAAQQPGEG